MADRPGSLDSERRRRIWADLNTAYEALERIGRELEPVARPRTVLSQILAEVAVLNVHIDRLIGLFKPNKE